MFKDFRYNLLDERIFKKEPQELYIICKNLFSKGKHLRSKLVTLVSESIGLERKKIILLNRIIEYIHNSSLLHDDFIDQTMVRRNEKTTWVEFSPIQAILAGDYLLGRVAAYIVEGGCMPLLDLTAEALCSLSRGEFLQRELHKFSTKDIRKVNEVSWLKTGILFGWSLKAPFIFQNRKDPKLYKLLSQISYNFGMLYQRSDDLLDFYIGLERDKPALEDLKQSYYNSFSCYLMKGVSPSVEKEYQKCKNVSAVKKTLPHFQKTLNQFHQDNKALIEKTEKEIDRLKPLLKKGEISLVQELHKIPFFLYWRKFSG